MHDRTPAHADYVFVAHNAGRWLMRVALVASLVGFCVSATLAVSERSFEAVVATGLSAVCLVVFWALLEARIPQRIMIKGPLIEVRRNGRVDSFHLEDPAVDIRVMDGEIAFSAYTGRWVVVRARDVDWHVFTDVVMHYQDKADRDAEAREKRFSS